MRPAVLAEKRPGIQTAAIGRQQQLNFEFISNLVLRIWNLPDKIKP
jgi:hypothetical protein